MLKDRKLYFKTNVLGRRLLKKTTTKVLKTIIVVEHVRMRDKHQKWLLITSFKQLIKSCTFL